ncbi:MAG TPA: IS200/IS605 family transposase [Candidatus Eisenbacteria bacterium]|nr:IS200/IS605 family transposase [Candidatus Eisenbacteria bacterium]
MNSKVAPPINEALHERWEPVYRSRLHYLVTWSTRGRRPILKERHARKVHELVAKVCDDRGFELLDVAVGQDHVHALFGLKPSQSVATAVREIKSRTGLALMSDHPELRVWLGGNLLWDERYAVETVSPIRLEHVQRKLRHLHGPPETLAEAG